MSFFYSNNPNKKARLADHAENICSGHEKSPPGEGGLYDGKGRCLVRGNVRLYQGELLGSFPVS